MGVSAAVIGASALLAATPRLIVWAGLGVAWIVGIVLAARRSRVGLGLAPTDSLVERFGLFTIIVLGEVVLGVVAGLSVAERDAKTIITGMLALWLGFGFWWIYFDLVGRRLPRADGVALANWVLSHLPITGSITAAGAGMVSLIGHAHDARTPAGTSWLLAGAVATGLLALVLTEQALVDAERLSVVFDLSVLALAGGSGRSPARRLATTGALAAGVAAGGGPVSGLVLRRQPLPARRRLGRTMTGTFWRGEAGLEGEQLGVPGKGLEALRVSRTVSIAADEQPARHPATDE